jgi:hypothetical protein
MPIAPENRGRYPSDWKAISLRIRFARAGGQCECDGRCGQDHAGGRCAARHGLPHPDTGSVVVLTTMHLDHTPENCADDNLSAGCQRCHLRYDRAHHAESRRKRVRDKAGQLAFELACGLA